MNQEYLYITKSEYQKLLKELQYRDTLRNQISTDLGLTVEANNDLRENSTYDELLRNQELNELRISEIHSILATYKVLATKKTDSKISVITIGSKIVMGILPSSDLITYHLVSEVEANPFENKISILSPFGSQIIGKKIGYKFKLNQNIYQILQIL